MCTTTPSMLLVAFFSSILDRHPVSGNVTVVHYFLHLMNVFTLFQGTKYTMEHMEHKGVCTLVQPHYLSCFYFTSMKDFSVFQLHCTGYRSH